MGKAFPNERVMLLNSDDSEITAPNLTGEVCVVGTCVALGYCGLPEQTASAFVPNPLSKQWTEFMYRTGDLAKYNDEGLLLYVGRKDFQIKRNGRRVELGEIENAMQSLDGINRACVIYNKENKKLIGCYTATECERKILNKALSSKLPDYMIPDSYFYVDTFPLNLHGKIDRAKLLQLSDT